MIPPGGDVDPPIGCACVSVSRTTVRFRCLAGAHSKGQGSSLEIGLKGWPGPGEESILSLFPANQLKHHERTIVPTA